MAVILGFAYIVGADLKSRTSGTVAIYEARKAITLQLLQKVLTAPQASETQCGADQGNSPTPLTSANAVIALAAAGAKAQTLRKTDQQVGHLARIRCDDKVSVKWLDNDGKEYWSDPNDMTVESYTY